MKPATIFTAIIAGLLLLGLSGCGSRPASGGDSAAGGPRLNVVATTSIIADIVRQVGGEYVSLTTLLPAGVDPHAFEPTPRDLAAVADADLVFANGFGLELFLGKMLAGAGEQVPVVYVSEGITPRQPGEADQDHPGEEVDPHTWTSPANVLVFVDNIEQALAERDPAHTDAYRANAARYRQALVELDEWVQAQIEQIPPDRRKLVTDHPVFGYYADRYGLEQVGAVIPSFSTAAEPSAGELAALEEQIRRYQVRAIFVGNTVNPALSERVARDTGVRLLTLYTGSLGGPDSGVETYLDYIRFNTRTIVEGLAGE